MRTLFSLFQISDRNRDNVKSYKESCQLAFAKRIRRVSKEMAKIITLKILMLEMVYYYSALEAIFGEK